MVGSMACSGTLPAACCLHPAGPEGLATGGTDGKATAGERPIWEWATGCRLVLGPEESEVGPSSQAEASGYDGTSFRSELFENLSGASP